MVEPNCNTMDMICYNCNETFQYNYGKSLILRKRAHGLVSRNKDGIVTEYVGCPKCKDRSSLHFVGEIYDEWSTIEKRWVL